MFNDFDFFNEPIDWFVDEIDLKFERYRRKFKDITLKAENEIIDKFKLSETNVNYEFKFFNNIKTDNIFQIERTFNNINNECDFQVKRTFNNINNECDFQIERKFSNIQNFAFERIGFIQIPPKRVIFKDFDE